MFSRSRMVAEYSSRFSRRIGDGPGTGPSAQAACRKTPSTQETNFSRSSMPGAGLPLGGISDPRTRASTRLQVGRARTTLSGVRYAVRSTFAAAVLPWWQATQYVFSVDWTESNEAVAGAACDCKPIVKAPKNAATNPRIGLEIICHTRGDRRKDKTS